MSVDDVNNPMDTGLPTDIPAPESVPTQTALPHYVEDFNKMLALMNDNQAIFQSSMAAFIDQQRQMALVAAANPRHSSIKVKEPRIFNGRHEEVKAFISEVEDTIHLQRQGFTTDKDKSLYMGRYLKDGSPKEWFNNIKQYTPVLLDKFPDFIASFKSHFADPNIQATAMRRLDALKQTGSAHAYITKFY